MMNFQRVLQRNTALILLLAMVSSSVTPVYADTSNASPPTKPSPIVEVVENKTLDGKVNLRLSAPAAFDEKLLINGVKTSMPAGATRFDGESVFVPGDLFPWKDLGLTATWSKDKTSVTISNGITTVSMKLDASKDSKRFSRDEIEPLRTVDKKTYVSITGVLKQFKDIYAVKSNGIFKITITDAQRDTAIVKEFLSKQPDLGKFIAEHNKSYPVMVIDGKAYAVPQDGVLKRSDKPKTTGYLKWKDSDGTDGLVKVSNTSVNYVSLSESNLMTPEVVYLHEHVNDGTTSIKRFWASPFTTSYIESKDGKSGSYEWLKTDVYLVDDTSVNYDQLRKTLDPNLFEAGVYDQDANKLSSRLNAMPTNWVQINASDYTGVIDSHLITFTCLNASRRSPVEAGISKYKEGTTNVEWGNLRPLLLSRGVYNAAAPKNHVTRQDMIRVASGAGSSASNVVNDKVSLNATTIWLNADKGAVSRRLNKPSDFAGTPVELKTNADIGVSLGSSIFNDGDTSVVTPTGTAIQKTKEVSTNIPVKYSITVTGKATADKPLSGKVSSTADGKINFTELDKAGGEIKVTVEHGIGDPGSNGVTWCLIDARGGANPYQWYTGQLPQSFYNANPSGGAPVQVFVGAYIGYKYTFVIKWPPGDKLDCPPDEGQWNSSTQEIKDKYPKPPIPEKDGKKGTVEYDNTDPTCWKTTPPEPDGDCPDGDCDPPPPGGDPCNGPCPEKFPRQNQTDPDIPSYYNIIAETDLRWNNVPTAFAETKMGVGYQQFAETTQGNFTLDRGGEHFEAMMGMPETERLYVNGGATEGEMDVKYVHYEVDFNMTVKWTEIHDCPAECTEYDCPPDDPDDPPETRHEWNPGPLWADLDVVTGKFVREHKFKAKFLFLKDAGYTTAEMASIVNTALYADGSFTVDPKSAIPHSFSVTGPPGANSVSTPGTSRNPYLHGALINWRPVSDFGVFKSWTTLADCTWNPAVDGPKWDKEVQERWRAEIGDIFTQNDDLWIKIGNVEYVYVEPRVNFKNKPLIVNHFQTPAYNELISSESPDDFNPRGESWEDLFHVPVSGYKGFDLTSPNRNQWSLGVHNGESYSGGQGFWLSEDRQIVPRRVNGVYSFEPWETQNVMNYPTHNTIKGSYTGLIPKAFWEGMTHQPEDVVTPPRNVIANNKVELQYTSWQPKWGGMTEPNHATGDASTDDPPTYYSINPVIIHNPTANLFAWVHDVPNTILEDQRIYLLGKEANAKTGVNGSNISPAPERGDIVRHPYALDDAAPARLYIDFDFRVTIPNEATLRNYWHPTGNWDWGVQGFATTANGSKPADWSQAGIVDLPEDVPNLRGKGYDGNFTHRYAKRFHGNPYVGQGWDVRKWLNAKFVKFPFDVYYYGTVDPRVTYAGTGTPTHTWGGNAHPGGDQSGFYPKETWIMLYDNGFVVPGGDPTVFDFRVASHVKDSDSAVIQFVTENINARDLGVGGMSSNARGQFDWDNGEWANNGRRDKLWHMTYGAGGDPLGQPLAAQHSTKLEQLVHVIGRIGNVEVDDNADPRWTSIFWDVDSAGNPKTGAPNAVNRFIAGYFNIYESMQNRNYLNSWAGKVRHPASVTESFINRYGKLSPWHSTDITISATTPYILPLMRNPLAQYNRQVTLLGYEIQYSVQTIGDYDRAPCAEPNCAEGSTMIVQPKHNLVGAWDSINPGDRWYMYASDPYDPKGHMRMFYDSNLIWGETPGSLVNSAANYSRLLNGPSGVWKPDFIHNSWHTLASTRAKINTAQAPNSERDTPAYLEAVKKGSQSQVLVGTPSFMNIKQTLRTWTGSDYTKGRTGEEANWVAMVSSNDKVAAWKNTQRWNGRFSLPRTTQVISQANLAKSKFEGRTSDQLIATSFSFRTNSCNTLWDLAIFTNTAVVPGTNGLPDYPGAWEDTPKTYIPGVPDTFKNRTPWNWGPWRWVRRPHDPSGTTPPGTKPIDTPQQFYPNDPGTPIIIVDYSNPGMTDSVTIGTH